MREHADRIFKFTMDTRNFIGVDLEIEFDILKDEMAIIGFGYTKSEDGIMSYIDIDENISEFYIRDNGDSVESVYTLFSKYFKGIKVKEVTEEVLHKNELVHNIKEDEDLYEKRTILFENFRKEMTSIDNVLDKIIDKGMDYLDDIDKEVLENKKPS